jgi:hypothetical protein
VGYEMYEMDIADRNLLLRELKNQFGQKKLDELGEFLLDYVTQRLTGDDPDTQDSAQAQEWTALVYTKPDQAARQLAEALSSRIKQQDMAEVLHLASLVENLAEPLVEAGFEPLLLYSCGMISFVRKDLVRAKEQFDRLHTQAGKIQVAGVSLYIPLNTNLAAKPPFELLSAVGVDYSRLCKLLANKKWKEADRETKAIMLKVAKRERDNYLRLENIDNFPCKDLRTIDKLWSYYSDERFGFSVQRRIWIECGGQPGVYDLDIEVWTKFGERVGWKVNGYSLDYDNLTFDINAPVAHLPKARELIKTGKGNVVQWIGRWVTVSAIAYRLSECST